MAKTLRFMVTPCFTVSALAAMNVACGDQEDDEGGTNNGAENNGDNNGATNNGTNNGTHNGDNNGVVNPKFVMLDDTSTDTGNDTPGGDFDAVAIEKGEDEFYAESVEDFEILGDNNGYTDTDQILGAPDSGCMKENFTSLGGVGGWIILGFGDNEIEPGDNIVVYELGPTVCPDQANWKDDPYSVSISVSAGDVFTELCTAGEGQNVCPYTGE